MPNLNLLIDLHRRNERQGPGADEETRRAIELARLDTTEPLVVADIGCGVGASALVLARTLNAHITAIDAAPAFIKRLRERAADEGLGDRITAQIGDMRALPFRDEQFDLIWSEGAIYNMGFAAGLRAWRRFLRPHGALAVTELTWTTATRPHDIDAHWTREYPGIATASANLRTLELEGYRPLACFFLPEHCWTDNYYTPLQRGFDAFLERHGHSHAARQIVEAEQTEIDLRRARGEWYGYAFYIARKCSESAP
jgi:SAM-dependent methyltransferase